MYITIIISTLVALNIATLTLMLILYRKQSKLLLGIKSYMEQRDNRLTKALVTNPIQAPPSPNEATKEEEDVIPLDEQTPWQIPQDVKIEIEGDYSNVPFEYEVTNANS